MSQQNANILLERSLNDLSGKPRTVEVIRRIQRRFGSGAAFDALVLLLIQATQGNASAFSFAETLRHFNAEHPLAVGLLDQAISNFNQEAVRKTLRQN